MSKYLVTAVKMDDKIEITVTKATGALSDNPTEVMSATLTDEAEALRLAQFYDPTRTYITKL